MASTELIHHSLVGEVDIKLLKKAAVKESLIAQNSGTDDLEWQA